MGLSEKDSKKIIDRYTERYEQYGYDPKTLGWVKGKQNLRFSILTSQIDIEGKSICDIGCGFGDLNKFLEGKVQHYSYYGIDIIDSLIKEATARYANDKIHFRCGDFLKEEISEFDYAIASGIFNFKLEDEDNYTYIENVIKKAFSLCKEGLAFDFLSDKVDYFNYEHTFHSSPEKILSIAYKYTRNIILKNNYMPFEFSVFLFKDDSFNKEDTIFNKYKTQIHYEE